METRSGCKCSHLLADLCPGDAGQSLAKGIYEYDAEEKGLHIKVDEPADLTNVLWLWLTQGR